MKCGMALSEGRRGSKASPSHQHLLGIMASSCSHQQRLADFMLIHRLYIISLSRIMPQHVAYSMTSSLFNITHQQHLIARRKERAASPPPGAHRLSISCSSSAYLASSSISLIQPWPAAILSWKEILSSVASLALARATNLYQPYHRSSISSGASLAPSEGRGERREGSCRLVSHVSVRRHRQHHSHQAACKTRCWRRPLRRVLAAARSSVCIYCLASLVAHRGFLRAHHQQLIALAPHRHNQPYAASPRYRGP